MITELEELKDCRIGTLKNSSNTKALAVYMARQGFPRRVRRICRTMR